MWGKRVLCSLEKNGLDMGHVLGDNINDVWASWCVCELYVMLVKVKECTSVIVTTNSEMLRKEGRK